MKFYYANNVGDVGYFKEKSLTKAIHMAWNIEASLYIVHEDSKYNELVFSPHDDNEFNNEMLDCYGYKIEDIDKWREIIEIKTGKIIKYNNGELKELI